VNIYYLFGESTLDEIIYPMISLKSSIISNTLDGQKSEFKMKTDKSKLKEESLASEEIVGSTEKLYDNPDI